MISSSELDLHYTYSKGWCVLRADYIHSIRTLHFHKYIGLVNACNVISQICTFMFQV